MPPELIGFYEELQARHRPEGDPVHGEWSVNREAECILSTNASDIAYGAVLEVAGVKVEDRSWLREQGDKRQINVAELDAVIKGLNMCISWEFQCIRLVTDSKTVAAWLHDVLKNVRRVKTSGLYDVLIQRRLQILSDLVITTGITVSIELVPSQKNAADVLTLVPDVCVKYWKRVRDSASVVAAVSSQPAGIVGPIMLRDIQTVQLTDDQIQAVIRQLEHDLPLEKLFTKVRSQLVVEDTMLWRSVKLPIEGVVQVPVIAADFVEPILQAAHINSGHAPWSTMYQMIRKKCYFPKIAVACREYVSKCGQCGRGGPLASVTRCDIPGRPWQEVVVNILELGSDGHAEYHCVLMCVDVVTKWLEVIPLRRHDAKSAAAAFTGVCRLWGAPEVVRSDNRAEFRNAIVDSLFKSMGVRVRTGAVRHLQSQGAAKRANRTLIGFIRKVLDGSSDWKCDLRTLLFFFLPESPSLRYWCSTHGSNGWLAAIPPHR